MLRIGLLCGSLGPASANRAALEQVASHVDRELAAATFEIVGLAALPAFEPQLVDEPPAVVVRFRSQIDDADGMVIGAPEYAAGLAGSTKNALDWLVGASTLYSKPVAVLSAGTTGGPRAIDQLVHTLSWQGALTFGALGIEAPRTKMADGMFTDETTVEELRCLADGLIAAIRGSSDHRSTALRSVVSAFGIDVARFGAID